MPRYFLDFTDTGELLRDDEGMELVDLEAARMEALASLGEIAKDQLRDGDRRDFIIDIRETINNAALLQNRRTGARGDGWETEMEDATLRAALKRHWDASDASDFDAEHEIYREDAVLDYPQSGERIRGRHNIQESRFVQPNKKRFTVRRIIGSHNLWVTEFVLAYDGIPSYAVSIMEFHEGLVTKETQYFADGFDPAPSRAHLVERVSVS